MTELALRAENLGKRYKIGAAQPRYQSLRDSLTQAALTPLRWLGRAPQTAPANLIWALKEVSFEIKVGEVVGIIGRNGAGKSTLLKILARITEPTEGQLELCGRVGPLLEVGTGFHPELTGRENVYLNGAILGMTRREIQRKFDEIVAFAEVEKFIETPVKHYSSGMYLRLAFAVAAHLEPEILLVDEVLAVGDAEFQKKCLGKMGEVSRAGRTVLFVSHNMPAVIRLCQTAILLENGKIKRSGNVNEVTAQYLLTEQGSMAERQWDSLETSPGDGIVRLKAVRAISQGVITDTVDIRYPVTIEMDYVNLKPDARLLSGIAVFNDQGILLFVSGDLHDQQWDQPRATGLYRARCEIPGNLLAEGIVRVLVEVSTRAPFYQMHVHEYDAVAFNVIDRGEPGSVRSGWGIALPGVVRPFLNWETCLLTSAIEQGSSK